MPDALQLLREDHNHVKDLFQRFEKTESKSEKKSIANEAIMELMIHAQIEEDVFYPAMKKQLGDVMLLHEAEQEHHVAEVIMEELQTMRLSDKSFEAKFTVLAENVKHHIDEEEGEMFPKAAEAGRQKLMDIGNKLQERKMELKEEWERPRKRAASSSSRNGRSSAGRTRSTATKKRTSTRSTSASKRSPSGTRSRATGGTRKAASKSGTRSAASRARAGGQSRARNASKKRTTTATKRRSTSTRSRR
jgi:hypothetical protein